MAEASAFFSGSVEEAIKKVKDQNSCLLVFVYGDDEVSKKYQGYFSSHGKLAQATSGFVCMQLAAQSDTAMQFSAYYPVVSLPTIYLVGADGVSLEALIGDRSEEDLVARIAAAATGGARSPGPAAAAAAGADWDTRVQRMEQKMEERQAEKQREAAEKEKRLEQERRSVGKNLGQLRQQQQEEQEKAWAEEVRQERQARLRERQQQQQQKQQQQQLSSNSPDAESTNGLRDLRAAQSAAYHQERRAAEVARSAADAEAEAAKSAAALQAEVERRRVARMQIRCPDGRVFVRELPSSATLRDLRRSVDEDFKSPRYRLATNYPRRVFLDSELDSSLADLELAPSACLLLLPPDHAGGGGVSGGGSTAAAGVVSLVSAPFVFLARLLALLLGFFTALFGLGGGTSGAAASQAPGASASPQASAAAAAAASRRSRGSGSGGLGATVQRSGNTARLRNIPGANGNDDEDATWNGNSTQQM